MEQKQGLKFPLRLLVLDGLGSILMGLGIVKVYAGIDILPASMQFEGYGWTLVVVGALMMLPFLWHLFAKVREQAEQKLIK